MLKAFFQLKKTKVQEKKIDNIDKYPTTHGLMGTSNIITNGKNIKTNQNKEKIVPGNNQVPTIFLIKTALNRINKLKNIDSNFDKISRANFVRVYCDFTS